MSTKRTADNDMAGSSNKKVMLAANNSSLPLIVINTPISLIPVSEIDKYITKPQIASGICTIQELKVLECRFACPLVQGLIQYQMRLLRKQVVFLDDFESYAASHEPDFAKKFKFDDAVAQASRLLVLADNPDIQARPALLDAILYRATFISFFAAFNSDGGGSAKAASDKFTKIIEKAQLTMDIPTLVEHLTAASERHLSRKEDRSSIWSRNIVPPGISAINTIPPPVSRLSNNLSTDPISANWVALKAGQYIEEWDSLSQRRDLVGFEAVDNVSAKDKRLLRSSRIVRRLNPKKEHRTPKGVLLHGPQGSGKTSFVVNWCHWLKGTMITIDAGVKGPLEGQTEELLGYLINKAIELGKQGPVVLLLDEADQILNSIDATGRVVLTQSYIKNLLSTLDTAKSEVYFFAATNSPSTIKLDAGWNRRLQLKVHVRLPGTDGRTAIMSRLLENVVPGIPEERVKSCADKLHGYSPSDITYIVDLLEGEASIEELGDNEYWKEEVRDGRNVLVAAREGEIGVIVCRFDDMSDEDAQRVFVPKCTVDDLDRHIESCLEDPRLRTVTSAEIKEHEDWASKFSRVE